MRSHDWHPSVDRARDRVVVPLDSAHHLRRRAGVRSPETAMPGAPTAGSAGPVAQRGHGRAPRSGTGRVRPQYGRPARWGGRGGEYRPPRAESGDLGLRLRRRPSCPRRRDGPARQPGFPPDAGRGATSASDRGTRHGDREGQGGAADEFLLDEVARIVGRIPLGVALREPSAPAAPRVAPGDVRDQLRRLGELRDAGVITRPSSATRRRICWVAPEAVPGGGHVAASPDRHPARKAEERGLLPHCRAVGAEPADSGDLGRMGYGPAGRPEVRRLPGVTSSAGSPS